MAKQFDKLLQMISGIVHKSLQALSIVFNTSFNIIIVCKLFGSHDYKGHKIGTYVFFFQNKEWELKGQQKRTTTATFMQKGQEMKTRVTSNS